MVGSYFGHQQWQAGIVSNVHSEHVEGLYCDQSPALGPAGEAGPGRELRVVPLQGIAGRGLGLIVARCRRPPSSAFHCISAERFLQLCKCLAP
jgi:hypothetical protein